MLRRSRNAQPQTAKDLHAAAQKIAWYHWIPIFNLIFDFMLFSIPTVDAVKEIMNSLGLVDALLLAVVMAIPSSVSHNELEEANFNFGSLHINNTDGRFPVWPNYAQNTDPKTGWPAGRDGPGQPQYLNRFGTKSNQLAYIISGAAGALTCSLLNVVITYFFLVINKFANVEAADEDALVDVQVLQENKKPKAKETDWTVWWQIVKWLIACQFVATAVGVVLAFLSLMNLMVRAR